MADLDDLGFLSISDMQNDEALELLRQIRLSRRVPIKTTKTIKKSTKPKVSVDADQAAQLLKLLTGEK